MQLEHPKYFGKAVFPSGNNVRTSPAATHVPGVSSGPEGAKSLRIQELDMGGYTGNYITSSNR